MNTIRSLRRRVIITCALLSLICGIAVTLYARFVHPYQPRISHRMVQLPRAHRHLDGLIIAFVSDTHIGPHFTGDDLAPVVQLLRRAKPDLVLFGGDYISESPRFLESVRAPLRDMAELSKYGAYGILGNHDLSNIRERVVDMLGHAGITVLQNDAVKIETRQGPLWIVGIDDAILGKTDLRKAFACVPADAPAIAMWHEPDHSPRAEPFGPFLLLCGHTHGGQVRIPGLGPLSLPTMGKKYVSGRYEIGDMTMFVSNGVGMYRPPVRLNCPPEVLLIRLIA
jgi:predicted MPP superfamily phosphohydrolase